LNESVQFRLSLTLSLSILVVAMVAGAVSFLSAFDEAHELQDDVLRQVAQIADPQHLSPAAPVADARLNRTSDESRVIVQRLVDVDPSLPGVDAGGVLRLPATLTDGLHTVEVGGESFRVLVKTTVSKERIAVAQESSFRNEIARVGALRTVMPLLLLVPILLVVVAVLVRKMFRPIAALSNEIDQRAETDLRTVEEHRLPHEVRPFVVAINRLLVRVGQSIESQHRFVTDAAHELRSPFTALSLQTERLAGADMSSVARERLSVMRQGIERSRSLLDQLLTLAKARAAIDRPLAPVSIQCIFRRVLEDLMPLAEAKHLDIGVEGAHDAQVWVSELDMIAIVKNLVDNAIRYTPDGGRVDLSLVVSDGAAIVCIRDSGPGIPVAERERVFDPFYRAPGSEQFGSGLGLSIVRTIAHRIGAQVHLDFSDPIKQTGLGVTVLFPILATSQRD
jgi:two-component system OmpR family sensor kinase